MGITMLAVDTSVQLIAGANGNGDSQDFGVAGAQANAFVAPIPDAATAFRATIRTEYINGLGGVVILQLL